VHIWIGYLIGLDWLFDFITRGGRGRSVLLSHNRIWFRVKTCFGVGCKRNRGWVGVGWGFWSHSRPSQSPAFSPGWIGCTRGEGGPDPYDRGNGQTINYCALFMFIDTSYTHIYVRMCLFCGPTQFNGRKTPRKVSSGNTFEIAQSSFRRCAKGQGLGPFGTPLEGSLSNFDSHFIWLWFNCLFSMQEIFERTINMLESYRLHNGSNHF